VKIPGLLVYANDNLEKQITREVETCDILRKNPHPNIAPYYGYMIRIQAGSKEIDEILGAEKRARFRA
jgi:hypothetical protein